MQQTAPVPPQTAATGKHAIPYDLLLAVKTVDVIDAAGIDSGRKFRTTVEHPVASVDGVLIPAGAELVFRTTKYSPSVVWLEIESVNVPGRRVSVTVDRKLEVLTREPEQPAQRNTARGPRVRGIPQPTPNAPRNTVYMRVPAGKEIEFRTLSGSVE